MATKDFLLPDLGEGLTEAEIVSWLVAVGDTVAVDQPVAEVETAKAVVEVPSPFAGTIAALHAAPGEEIAVGSPLMTVELAGADTGARTPGAAAPETQTGELVPDPEGAGGDGDQGTVAGRPPAEGGADSGSGNVLVGYGTSGPGRSRRRRAGVAPPGRPGPSGPPPRPATPAPAAAPAPAAGPAGPTAGGVPLAKPPVRKLAKELGVDLGQVRATGPHGTVSREDVLAFAGQGEAAVPPTEDYRQLLTGQGNGSAPVVVTDAEHTPLGSAPPNEQRIPVRGVRRAISEKMTRSRREIPDATSWVDCDATPLWELRQRLAARHPEQRITPLAVILRAVVAALRRYPTINAHLSDDGTEIVVPEAVHLGVAAQTERGLVVAVIRDAHRRTLLELAGELARLTTAARDGSIRPEELTGSTFTVSNYGSFGVDGGSAIINHPEAAILGVGRIADKPWVVDGQLAVRKVLQLSIAFDHRILDGGEAAGFLRLVADCVEDPDVLLSSL